MYNWENMRTLKRDHYYWVIPRLKLIPSRKLTYPTWGKGKSSSNMPFLEGYVNSLEGNPIVITIPRPSPWTARGLKLQLQAM